MGGKRDAFAPPQARYLRFVELWTPRDWALKVYLHSAHGAGLPHEFLASAKRFIEPQLPDVGRLQTPHGVGFLILAHGAVSNWLMLDWWSSLHLYQRIFQAEGMPPQRFTEAPPGLVQCVYDLRITAFESEAWRIHALENPTPDLQAYLNARLNVDL
jgi:hypothetical protein